jgi:cytochrome c peroxidase
LARRLQPGINKTPIRRRVALAVLIAIWFAPAVASSAAPGGEAAFAWHLPPGFPRPLVPADNPMSDAKVSLGERLFHDTRLSINGSYACATCHRRELAFTDGRGRAVGATGEPIRRGAMTLTNVVYNVRFTWASSRLATLEAQMLQPLFNRHPVEMGLERDASQALAAFAADADYVRAFRQAFPHDPMPLSLDHVVKSIAAYERTLISGRSAFDRYVYDDDQSALSGAARRGMTLFYSARIGCATCHSGINFSGPIRYEGHNPPQALFANNALHELHGRVGYPTDDHGLIEVSHRSSDMGRYRVPTLRNVAITAPYMHDGSLATLADVVRHYEQAGQQNRRLGVRLGSFRLSEPEQADLIAFLNALTDPQFLTP